MLGEEGRETTVKANREPDLPKLEGLWNGWTEQAEGEVKGV